ncbi:MAG: FAD-dependent oxidoreductase [Myxococcales bacterium]|nr:FAD-dependent oxidoreductase [Myxococcales bacterium]
MSKTVLCTCEDVTVEDVETAIAKGYRDVESVKRYTGFGTGFCQGKSCLSAVADMLCRRADLHGEALAPFTPRPPWQPTELSILASAPVDESAPPVGGVPVSLGLSNRALRPSEPLPARAQVVVIGGGIMGLALAHNLSLWGERDILVLDKSYLCAGASGRNGGGVRMQWGTQSNIELAKRSIELMKGFAGEMGIHIWFRQGGYLFLAKSDAVARRLERSAALHNRHGVPTQILSAEDAREIVPELTMQGVKVCAFNRRDGVIFPWPFLWGYAQSLTRRGARVETFTKVTGFELSQGRVRAVKTDRGDVSCEAVVLAAGAWSPEVAALAGVKLPNQPHRHEILSTEPLKPFLGPLVSVMDSGLYFSQSTRGELVGGMGDPKEPAGMNLGSTLRFLSRFARALIEQLPEAGRIKVLRQWAGPYDVTPDNSPILGRTPTLPNLLQMSGFVGHGFMMAPAVAERMAAWMGGQPDELFTRFNLSRFAEGRLEREDMIIG